MESSPGRCSLLLASFILHFVVLLPLGSGDLGMRCSDHLGNGSPSSGILLRSWETLGHQRKAIVNAVAYYPRFADFQHKLVRPSSQFSSSAGLDLLYIPLDSKSNSPDVAKVYMQRPARVYLMAAASSSSNIPPSSVDLPGWQPLGLAARLGTHQSLSYGLFQKHRVSVPSHVYVFWKRTSGSAQEVVLPQQKRLRDSVRGVPGLSGDYHVRIAEDDGRPSTEPRRFRGVNALPNKLCPAILHSSWGVQNDDQNDRFTRGKIFGSWHPQWDPCYWCSYGHEHGSAAPLLMSYRPKYGYTEFKKSRGQESNPGFKDFVIENGDYLVYFSFHAQTSSLRRTTVRLHTVTIAVRHVASRDLVAEITMKGNFGFLASRKAGNGNTFIPVTNADRIIEQDLADSRRGRFLRSINVINKGNLDPRFHYRKDLLRGNYELWVTSIPCAAGQLSFNIIDPISGVRDDSLSEKVRLGAKRDSTFYDNVGAERTVHSKRLTVGASKCGFGPEFKGGTFYTDPLGQKILKSSSRDAVRQYIKPGFSLTMSGHWRPVGSWFGLHRNTQREQQESFFDIGFGIDPGQN